MIRHAFRRVAIAGAGALLIGSVVAGPASALVPPPDPSSVTRCQTVPAGYSPTGAGTGTEGWEWDGRLSWDLCVVRTSSGSRYAIARLSSPSPTVLLGRYDRYTGVSNIYLQRCATRTYTTIGRGDWSVANYDVGTLSGSWYRFRWTQTTSGTSSATLYRVRIETWAAAVLPRDASFVFSLAQAGLLPVPGAPGVYNSSCMTI